MGAFVGRDRELSALAGYLERACAGRASLVLCCGEPGIGKTRLAEELTRLAADRGVATVWGVCVETEGAPPYWPWQQLFRGIARHVDLSDLASAHGLAADLARLAPGQFGGAPEVSASVEDRFRQFDAVTRLLGLVPPLVLIVDDAHWADRPSVLLLQHLARTLREEPLLLLVNHRDTEHDHAALFTELLREPITGQIDLVGLNTDAVAQQLASVVGRGVEVGDAEQVRLLTGGNPFFVGELARVLPAVGVGTGLAPVTANIREAIRGRLHRLTADAVRVLHAAAIIGREFSIEVVAAMVDAAPSRCLGPLDEGMRAGLIEVGTEHRFVHALVRDAVEAGLSSSERVFLHRRAADTILSVYAGRLEAQLFDLARHWAIAAVDSDRETAAYWIERAADEAMHTLGYEEGARLYRLALDVGATELDDQVRCRLLLGLARALNGSADVEGCNRTCEEAADLAEQVGSSELLADAALAREAIIPTLSEAVTRRLCERALARAEVHEPALRARLMARHAEASIYVAWSTAHGDGEYEIAASVSEEALRLAELSGDPRSLIAALRARRLARSAPEGLAEREALADRLYVVALAKDDAHAQMWAHLWHIDVAFERGALRDVARDLEDLARCVTQVRGPHARYELIKCRAVLAQAQGRFGDALRLADEAFGQIAATGGGAGFHERAGLLHQIGLHIGHDASGAVEASGYRDATVFERELPTAGVIIAVANANLLASAGRLDEATAVYRALGPPATWRPSPHAVLPALAFGIALAIATQDDDGVAVLRDRLSAYRGHHTVSGAGQVAYFGPVELALGRAAARLGRLDEATADLEFAVSACEANGAAGYEAEAQCELAAVLIRTKRSARARKVLETVIRRTTELGMTPFTARANTLKSELTAKSPLTHREWEVADLVARGLTNREIAAALFLSERTAQNHVQHVLTKLGLANRSRIAAWWRGEG